MYSVRGIHIRREGNRVRERKREGEITIGREREE